MTSLGFKCIFFRKTFHHFPKILDKILNP